MQNTEDRKYRVKIQAYIEVTCSIWDALKLRLAGPEMQHMLAQRLTESLHIELVEKKEDIQVN